MMTVQPPEAPPDLRPHLEGADTAWTLFRAIVEEPEAVKTFLKEWRKIAASYDKFTAAMQKHAAVAKVAELQDEAEKTLAAAKAKDAEAAQLVEVAKADAADIRQEARFKAEETETALANQTDELNRQQSEAQQALDAATANEAAARKYNEAAAKAREAAEKDRAEAAAYLAKIKQSVSALEAAD